MFEDRGISKPKEKIETKIVDVCSKHSGRCVSVPDKSTTENELYFPARSRGKQGNK